MKIARNRDAKEYVMQQREFDGSNLYGRHNRKDTFYQYVVYSYDTPIYVYEGGEEFVNGTRYSVTTSKHMGNIGVWNRGTKLTGDEMKELVLLGVKQFKKVSVEKALA